MNCGLLAYGPGLSVRCIQGLRRAVGKQLKKNIYFKGKEEKRQHFEGTKTILRNREQSLREQRNKPTYFRGTGTPHERASHITEAT